MVLVLEENSRTQDDDNDYDQYNPNPIKTKTTPKASFVGHMICSFQVLSNVSFLISDALITNIS